ncbi:ThiF family adenylyltransferase [bacterium]|nr:ThiF family adenylyltransferase [bacterium]
MDRLHRQRIINGWVQSYLSESQIHVLVSEETNPLLLDALIKGFIMIGMGAVHLICDRPIFHCDDYRAFANAIQSLTAIDSESNPDQHSDCIVDLCNTYNESARLNRMKGGSKEILAFMNNEKVLWTTGDQTGPMIHAVNKIEQAVLEPASLSLFLAGAVLAEVVRKLMPLEKWKHSEMQHDVHFPLLTATASDETYHPRYPSIAVIGAGALGNWFLYALLDEAMLLGVSEIILIDNDSVDPTNLNRQVFFTHEDTNKYKAEVIAEKIGQLYPGLTVIPITSRVEDVTFFDRKKLNPSILISCLDSWKARAIVNEIAKIKGIPLINGGSDPYSCNAYGFFPGLSCCLDCAIGINAKTELETHAASCRDAEPSVVFTNMIAAGLMLWLMQHPRQSCSGLLQYDLTQPERIGTIDLRMKNENCRCLTLKTGNIEVLS